MSGATTDGSGGPPGLVEPVRRVPPGWIGALSVAMLGMNIAVLTPIQVLLPLQIAAIDPVAKVAGLSLVNALAAVVAVVACPLAGALSDRTRSRLGRRRPWVLSGTVLGAAGLVLTSVQTTVLGVALAWMVVQAAINTIFAGLSAAVPDQVPVAQRGTVSAFVGLAAPLGLVLGAFLVTAVITGIGSAYLTLAVLLVVLALPYLLGRSDPPDLSAPRPREPVRTVLAGFREPWQAPDFRWAFLGRFAIMLANTIGALYLLYFLQDAVGLPDPAAGTFVLILLYTAGIVASSVVTGWLSDRLGRRKVFVIGSAAVVAGALSILAFSPTWPAALVAAPLLGVGMGAFLAVDSALITEVLPSAADRGRDLGVINLANTAPQVAGPLVAGVMISLVQSYTVLYVVAAAVALVGAALIRPIRGVR